MVWEQKDCEIIYMYLKIEGFENLIYVTNTEKNSLQAEAQKYC